MIQQGIILIDTQGLAFGYRSCNNVSRSSRGVLRGLHLQRPHDQGKLVSVLEGEVFDVAVDSRVGSPTFGRWVSALLSSQNHHQLYVPPGSAHDFCVTSEFATFIYKCSDVSHPGCELGIAFDDPDIGISWPIDQPRLSAKDRTNPRLSEVEIERLPFYEETACAR